MENGEVTELVKDVFGTFFRCYLLDVNPMIHLEDLSAIHSQGNLSDCALHAVGALGAYRRRWSHDGHSAAVMTKPHCRVCLLINESPTISKIFSRRERCGILKSK